MTDTLLGSGAPIFGGAIAEGTLVHFVTPEDVLAALDNDLVIEETVALVDHAGATFLAPIEADLAGIVCREGDIESHLAIVSRDFRIPALMNVAFDGEVPTTGTRVRIDTDAGTLHAIHE